MGYTLPNELWLRLDQSDGGKDEPLCEVNCVKVWGYSAPDSGLIVSMHAGKLGGDRHDAGHKTQLIKTLASRHNKCKLKINKCYVQVKSTVTLWTITIIYILVFFFFFFSRSAQNETRAGHLR